MPSWNDYQQHAIDNMIPFESDNRRAEAVFPYLLGTEPNASPMRHTLQALGNTDWSHVYQPPLGGHCRPDILQALAQLLEVARLTDIQGMDAVKHFQWSITGTMETQLAALSLLDAMVESMPNAEDEERLQLWKHGVRAVFDFGQSLVPIRHTSD